jgi:pimeloyl-ACP methyl ester carboxylesterase
LVVRNCDRAGVRFVLDTAIRLSDGRDLAYIDIGEAGWPCLLFFGGAPTSRLRMAYLEDAFLAEEIRLIAPERPGYGRSSPQRGRRVADWPDDVRQLADAMGLDRFIVSGHSSGGPYAVACLAGLPERVSAGIIIGGVTDMGWEGAWDGYNDLEAQLMRINNEAEVIAMCVERLGEDGSGLFSAFDFPLAQADEALFSDERIAPLLATARAEAFRQGVIGFAHDVLAQAQPWTFDLTMVTAPVHVLHGAEDTALPLAHSQHTAGLLPGSTLHVLDGHGHFSILSELPAFASRLAHR